jgi:hypothetical protein
MSEFIRTGIKEKETKKKLEIVLNMGHSGELLENLGFLDDKNDFRKKLEDPKWVAEVVAVLPMSPQGEITVTEDFIDSLIAQRRTWTDKLKRILSPVVPRFKDTELLRGSFIHALLQQARQFGNVKLILGMVRIISVQDSLNQSQRAMLEQHLGRLDSDLTRVIEILTFVQKLTLVADTEKQLGLIEDAMGILGKNLQAAIEFEQDEATLERIKNHLQTPTDQ